MATVELRVNGTARRVEGDPQRSLLSVLRDELDLTGAKYGCGEGHPKKAAKTAPARHWREVMNRRTHRAAWSPTHALSRAFPQQRALAARPNCSSGSRLAAAHAVLTHFAKVEVGCAGVWVGMRA